MNNAEALRARLADAKKNERHLSRQETMYWLDQYRQVAEQAVAHLTDPGYVRVPVEPTIGMIAALAFNGDIDLAIGHAQICEEIKELYRAMLAAAKEEKPY